MSGTSKCNWQPSMTHMSSKKLRGMRYESVSTAASGTKLVATSWYKVGKQPTLTNHRNLFSSITFWVNYSTKLKTYHNLTRFTSDHALLTSWMQIKRNNWKKTTRKNTDQWLTKSGLKKRSNKMTSSRTRRRRSATTSWITSSFLSDKSTSHKSTSIRHCSQSRRRTLPTRPKRLSTSTSTWKR